MAATKSNRRTGPRWMMWAFWAAGVGLLLVELSAGVEYLEAGLQQNLANILGWAPAIGMITLKAAEQAAWHWGTLSIVLRAVPLGVLGLLLVAFGVAFHGPVVNVQEQNANK